MGSDTIVRESFEIWFEHSPTWGAKQPTIMTKNDTALAKKLWNYLVLNQSVKKADVIVALGSQDLRTAERAADLYLEGFAPLVVCVGARGGVTRKKLGLTSAFEGSEGEAYKKVLVSRGVPESSLLVEDKSTNTGENISFLRELLSDRPEVKRLILVHKPYMERRTNAAFKKQWPDVRFSITSPQLSFEDYVNNLNPFKYVVNVMTGDMQRMKLYAENGYQVPQEIPSDVWDAYEKLVGLGYNQRLATVK